MPYFRIRYKTGNRRKSVVVEAENRVAAIERFTRQKQGIILAVRPSSRPLLQSFRALAGRRFFEDRPLRYASLIASYRQMGTMFDAGIPINTILEDLVEFTDDPRLQRIWQAALQGVEGGRSLTDSLTPYRRQIGNLSLSMIHLGEETGTFGEAVLKLADILEQIEENRRRLVKATRYPLFVIFAMMIAFVIVITMVVPQFQQLFRESQMELPFPTLFLLWIEGAVERYGLYILFGALGLVAVFSWFYNRYERVKLQTDRALLRVYIVGAVTRYAMLGRFVYIFTVLLNAGIPIITALETSISIVDNAWIKHRLERITVSIKAGQSFYQGMKETELFEKIVLQMIKAGEDSGSLNKMLVKVTKYYDDRYQDIVENVATMIEPILILAIAGFVLILALGIFLPLWSMVQMAA